MQPNSPLTLIQTFNLEMFPNISSFQTFLVLRNNAAITSLFSKGQQAACLTLPLCPQFVHISGRILAHSSLQKFSKSCSFLGCHLVELLLLPQFSYRTEVWGLRGPLHDVNVLHLYPIFCWLDGMFLDPSITHLPCSG